MTALKYTPQELALKILEQNVLLKNDTDDEGTNWEPKLSIYLLGQGVGFLEISGVYSDGEHVIIDLMKAIP